MLLERLGWSSLDAWCQWNIFLFILQTILHEVESRPEALLNKGNLVRDSQSLKYISIYYLFVFCLVCWTPQWYSGLTPISLLGNPCGITGMKYGWATHKASASLLSCLWIHRQFDLFLCILWCWESNPWLYTYKTKCLTTELINVHRIIVWRISPTVFFSSQESHFPKLSPK